MVKIENCGGDGQVLKVDTDATLSMNKNCEIEIKGCGETTGFKTATVSYELIYLSEINSNFIE